MNLEKAIDIAVEAHKGQKDKAGEPYILHPLRVMFKMQTEEEKIVAVLHDVVEDFTGGERQTIDWLKREGFSSEIIKALLYLTRTGIKSYNTYIRNLSENNLARKVKLADLEDNMDVRRWHKLANSDNILSLQKRYAKAYAYLFKTINRNKNVKCL